MDFVQFLLKKHLLLKGERKLKEISADQYNNRLENLFLKNIYNDEKQIDSQLKEKIKESYKDWKHYEKTIDYDIKYKRYLESKGKE